MSKEAFTEVVKMHFLFLKSNLINKLFVDFRK